MRDHTTIEELLTLESLHALDGGEREELRDLLVAHGPDCAECATLQAELAETAGSLPFALDPVAIAPGMRTAVLDRVAVEAPPARTGRSRGARPRGVLVAVAVAAALVAGVVVGANIRQSGSETTPDGLAALLAEPGAQLVHLEGSGGDVAVAVSGDATRAYVAGTGMDPLPEGKVYEVWSIAGDTPTSVACLQVADGKIGGPVNADMRDTDLVAVTVEDASCPGAPTTKPIMSATLS
jgi:anti-sigma-K factor RskA